jgi:hypothetical protein
MEAVSNAWHSLAVKLEKMREWTEGGGKKKNQEREMRKNWEE